MEEGRSNTYGLLIIALEGAGGHLLSCPWHFSWQQWNLSSDLNPSDYNKMAPKRISLGPFYIQLNFKIQSDSKVIDSDCSLYKYQDIHIKI